MSQIPEENTRSIAAVDLGSNSFHMIVAVVCDDNLQIVDRIKEMVRLAAGLDARNRLSPAVSERALACLSRFSQRLRDIPRGSVRIVGTNTLRKARKCEKFIAQAEAILGHPIEIISGQEEARLIYLGVSHSLEDEGERRLVIDIGGGSTEYIIGQHFKPEQMESLFMGCVSFSEQFFKNGSLTESRMRKAQIAALQEISTIREQYKTAGWDTAIGASGSIISIHDVIIAKGWSSDGITLDALKNLRQEIIDAGHTDKLSLPTLSEDRKPVFAGGVAILCATFESLGIELMRVSSGAVREGLLYDHLGRIHHEDVRERTIEQLLQRYGMDVAQAKRIEETALYLLQQVAGEGDLANEEKIGLLSRAARLHEIGLTIAHNQYHKHGAYLAKNLYMPGFSQGEQLLLSALIQGHRRRFPENVIKALPKPEIQQIWLLCIILRLSVLLHRSRSSNPLPEIHLILTDCEVNLLFPTGWLDENPLTNADLAQEKQYLKSVNCKLTYK
ncbi:MAG: exopolyphosphatase [Nitrosomonas sp.]|nr:exopolyphosphatase [Nitrosomonas sp.]